MMKKIGQLGLAHRVHALALGKLMDLR